MQQINNGFAACYELGKDGRVFNTTTKKYIKCDNKHCYTLKTEEGSNKKISLKKLYKLVYDANYCIDTIENITPQEEWREIAGTGGNYYASSEGRIKSLAGYEALILKHYINDKGYHKVHIVIEGQRCCKLVSRLVAAAFLDAPQSIDCQLHHLYGKDDNRACALQWLTPAEHRAVHSKMREQEKEQEENGSSTKPTNIDNK